VAEAHECIEVVCRVDTAHHTLVITEEEDRKTSDAVDPG
jgi:hypothetical protein